MVKKTMENVYRSSILFFNNDWESPMPYFCIFKFSSFFLGGGGVKGRTTIEALFEII